MKQITTISGVSLLCLGVWAIVLVVLLGDSEPIQTHNASLRAANSIEHSTLSAENMRFQTEGEGSTSAVNQSVGEMEEPTLSPLWDSSAINVGEGVSIETLLDQIEEIVVD
ncbi:hypothetical protein [Alteribacter populi]|uniref:hypothetical protein n=1 Tax=Alteribacter populi TaxID=2011011 RepID=UPI000BBB5D58|nr:hypothetical protein [Alteribacter populi]